MIKKVYYLKKTFYIRQPYKDISVYTLRSQNNFKYTIMKVLNILIISFLANFSFCQDYENMPVSVQQKMNQNKIEGIPVFSNIATSITANIENLNSEESLLLKQKLQSDNRIINFTLSSDNKSLYVKAKSDYTIDDIKAIIVLTNARVENYTADYFVD